MNKTIKTVKTNSKKTNSRTKNKYLSLPAKSYLDFICSLSYDKLRRI